ncbi:WXG100 family type VII secretion target [Micromonospora krabiensis]|uniref:WXG100 family type VII secretion target n=1 Tax=Micromonospora krabiensis TaxID=307121 RepID=A0A1C3MXN5_9ACTN|nr:WXG100 family type VII secretion target [Micromonospora krabiensis]SBV25064.1 WXG100 family type VII secretion target [Micromonospora krabiensis]
MADYDAAPEALQNGMQGLMRIATELKADLDTLNRVGEQFKATHSGQAIEGYDAAQREWNQGVNQMLEAAEGHSRNLGHIGENYLNADSQGRSLFGY